MNSTKTKIKYRMIFLLGALLSLTANTAFSAAYQIIQQTVNQGGRIGTSTNYWLLDVRGEVTIGAGTSTNYTLSAGYFLPDNSPPEIIILPAIKNIEQGSTMTITVSAFDIDDGDNLNMDFTLPSGATFTYTGTTTLTGTFTWRPGYDQTGSATIIFSVYDGHGGTTTQTVPVMVIAKKPLCYAYPVPPPSGENKIKFKYFLTESSEVTIDIYDISGDRIKTLLGDGIANSYGLITWDISDIPNGVYIYVFKAEGVKMVKKLMIVR